MQVNSPPKPWTAASVKPMALKRAQSDTAFPLVRRATFHRGLPLKFEGARHNSADERFSVYSTIGRFGSLSEVDPGHTSVINMDVRQVHAQRSLWSFSKQ